MTRTTALITFRRFVLAAALTPLAALQAAETLPPTLIAQSGLVELTTAMQRVTFTKSDGVFQLATFVRDGTGWRAFFDAGRPLLEGPAFDLCPVRYAILADAPDRKCVEFSGHHREPDYDWEMRVEATDSPLVRFTVTCHLMRSMMLDVPQPVVALWMRREGVAFHLDQGPDSIYGSAGIPHGYGFPAAYLWDEGCEAAVFFNMTPVRWMRPDGVARFHDVRIMTRSHLGQTGLGMQFKKLSGPQIPAGDMTVEFFLYQAMRPEKPTGLQALDTMIRLFAPLHPTESAIPRNQLTGGPASWDQLARQAMADLIVVPETMAELAAPWCDGPFELVPRQERMLVHSAHVMTDAAVARQQWDFSTVNNHLTPWLLLARLHGDAEALRLGLQKKDALPRFYDPQSQLLRHGTRQPPHVGDLEMCWQNFFFHEETLRAASATAPEDFNPALVGRFLMATSGLRSLARHVDFVFPQWFDPYTKQPVVQNDLKQLGIVREPWQVGGYAHLMMQAYEITGSNEFLSEAQRAVETLMERMEFRVHNEVYDRHYRDVAEFPVTELFGNARGIAAASQLYQATGDAKFLGYSRDFLNTLLRLTFWYEDESDAVSRELRNAGLFYPHGGAHVATPWETAEAHLMIAWVLKHDPSHPSTDLLLKLSNLNRVNAFFFFPATWTEPVQALDGTHRTEPGQYFPIEPFYCLEGTGGHRGPTAAYMAGLALWNAWLYEALAEASDPHIMVLNLDALEDFESAIEGVERRFLAYNPSPDPRSFQVRFKYLSDTHYVVANGDNEKEHSAVELRQGLPLALTPGGYARLTLRRRDYRERQAVLERQRAARNAIARAYQVLQEGATTKWPADKLTPDVQRFSDALHAYRAGSLDDATARAEQIVHNRRDRM